MDEGDVKEKESGRGGGRVDVWEQGAMCILMRRDGS